MIRTISAGAGLQLSNAYTSYPYISPGSSGAGIIRWNSNTNCMEINDGSVWKQVDMPTPHIEFDQEVKSILAWARTKKDEDLVIQDLIKKNPAVKDTYEKFQIMLALAKKELDNQQ